MFIPSAECRTLLRKYADHGLAEDDFTKLTALCKVHQPSLTGVLASLADNDSPIRKPPKVISELLSALARSTPVCALVGQNAELLEVLTSLAESELHLEAAQMKIVQEGAPRIAALLQEFGPLPQAMLAVVKEMVRISQEPFQQPIHTLERSESEKAAACFPTLPSLVKRGVYWQDKQKPAKPDTACNKKQRGHKTLSPGTVNVMCMHGMYYYGTYW